MKAIVLGGSGFVGSHVADDSTTPSDLPIRVIVFDCDGVILESMPCKGRAFRRLFRQWPGQLDAIEAFHIANGGMSRHEKIERIYCDILRLPLNDETRAALLEEFGRYVDEEILGCEFVAGAVELIEGLFGHVPLYVASAAPEDELRLVLERRKLAHYFKQMFGHPASKADALHAIQRAERVDATQMLFVGDARADVEAAASAGCRFIGRLPPDGSNPFVGVNIPVVVDCSAILPWLSAGQILGQEM